MIPNSNLDFSYAVLIFWPSLSLTVIYRFVLIKYFGFGAVAVKVTANVLKIYQLSTANSPQLCVRF